MQDRLRCWGPDVPATPATIGPVKKVVIDDGGICVIDAASKLSCWGGDLGYVPSDFYEVSDVSIEGSFICAQTKIPHGGPDPLVFCWIPSMGKSTSTVLATRRIWKTRKLIASSENVCGLDEFDDRLICENVWSQFGGGSTVFINHPTDVVGDYDLDGQDGCMMDKAGLIKCFGYGIETGHGGTPPVDAANALSVGRLNACAVMKYDQKITCWDLFDATYGSGVSRPIWDAAKTVATGFQNGCAILLDDTVKCWSNGPMGGGEVTRH